LPRQQKGRGQGTQLSTGVPHPCGATDRCWDIIWPLFPADITVCKQAGLPLAHDSFIYVYMIYLPITVVARSKAWTVLARLNTGIVGSNPTRGMDVCVRLFCVCVLLCIRGLLATGWSSVQGALPTVCALRNCKSAKVHKGCRAIDRQTDRQTDRQIDR
jgi:hypothetical protein